MFERFILENPARRSNVKRETVFQVILRNFGVLCCTVVGDVFMFPPAHLVGEQGSGEAPEQLRKKAVTKRRGR